MSVPCRYCQSPLALELIDLGQQPLANSYLEPSPAAIAAEPRFPLRIMICEACYLVQVEESIPAETIFDANYAYFSSYSSSWVAHAKRFTDEAAQRFVLGPDSMVIEIASNDGYLLQHFVARNIPCLGIEPAGNCAEAAQARGVETMVAFFNRDTARHLAGTGIRADLMIANNVLAHVPDISGFVAGFPLVLKPQGVACFEFPHLLSMISGCQFDTIYHEHYSYLSLTIVDRILKQNGMRIFDVEKLSTHGGSLRVFVCLQGADHDETARVAALRQDETAAALDQPRGYRDFASRARLMRDDLLDYLAAIRKRGEHVAAYGAAAKGNTFLNYCGVGPADIGFAVDRNPRKQGKLLPGSHIPVAPPDLLRTARPKAILILPWNLVGEIAAEHAYVREWGGHFVVASPKLRQL
ncbi:MAG: methyltransferase domain-containing protein [Aestuariivirga sp.]|uniref:class I SAM-dependent methyltransferase n=1 Tax=Aestuariivirga sp. TaxID=2650926 RepID=UPI0025BE3254|nr:class I SAM-dependent methyltransferase [Aestuariivirga sp.]MCA3562122.1 methyltransferase domain-containing protein [Aestuariivirga sp.]